MAPILGRRGAKWCHPPLRLVDARDSAEEMY